MMCNLFEKYGDTIEDDLNLKSSVTACGGIMYTGEGYNMNHGHCSANPAPILQLALKL